MTIRMVQMTESSNLPSNGSSRVIAFFDMDKTLLRASSGTLYLRHMLLTGEIPPARWGSVLLTVGQYVARRIEFPETMIRLYALSRSPADDCGRDSPTSRFDRILVRHIAPAAIERVHWHLAEGHHVTIISAQLEQFVRPVARAIGIGDAYLATRLLGMDGTSRAGSSSVPPFGPGKVKAAASYASSLGVGLQQCYFYSDSHSDLPLLESVGIPIAANPDRSLARIARARGWQVVRFF